MVSNKTIPTRERTRVQRFETLVPGDLVHLSAGDMVPASSPRRIFSSVSRC
jgi:magnesium-transporting ATPase (P-type)